MWTTSRSVPPVERSRTARALLGLLVVAAGTPWARHASAQAAVPLELSWDAVQDCPSKDAVLARVRQIVGAAPATAEPLLAEAKVTAQRNGTFQLRLTTHSGELVGVRQVNGKSCQDLAGITAFWLAILLNSAEPQVKRGAEGQGAPGAQGRAGESRPPGATPASEPPATQASSPPAQVVPPVPVAPDPREEAAPRRFHGLLALPLGAFAVGVLPSPSLGFGGGAGLSYDSWRVLVEGKRWASQHATAKVLLDDYAVELERLSLGLRVCRRMWGARFELSPCILVSLQHLSASGAGPNLAPRTPYAAWLSAGLGVQARLRLLPPLNLVAAVDGEIQTARPVVELGGVGTVERLPPAALTGIVGLEWIL